MSFGHRHGRGFTLLELVIALAIFSVAALTALKHSSQSVVQQGQLIDKTLALWIAENTIAEVRLNTPWPATGATTTTVDSAQREWRVTVEVSNTSLDTLRKVNVSVSPEDSDQPFATLTGYLGKH